MPGLCTVLLMGSQPARISRFVSTGAKYSDFKGRVCYMSGLQVAKQMFVKILQSRLQAGAEQVVLRTALSI